LPGPFIRLSLSWALYAPPVILRKRSQLVGAALSAGWFTGVRRDSANTGSPFGARLGGKAGYFTTFATASRTVFEGGPPGGALARKSVLQSARSVTQLAIAFARELKVASVDVSVPFGAVASTEPTAPVTGSARLAAMPTAFVMPYRLPAIR
jgi:hypothetical protein